MPDNKLELVIEVDVDMANASIRGINKGLSSFEQAARNAARGASQGIDGFTVSVAKGAAAGAVLASAFEKVIGRIRESGIETVECAAHTGALTCRPLLALEAELAFEYGASLAHYSTGNLVAGQ